ncbi:MAG: HupE/UreJ family protein [Sphingomonadales bacterium]|nr:HupE/UreJ family protein [Sphingomonadales bacterium]MBK9002401.1 HupE/UreJ family protein [Sphingomonadales bacterium]MBK9267631.1 HupE/UreJ family protein [Sphingomonadales bacterium]MBP6435005.1 HupE/UreJ family protein [Sphingorhabdus sp.]
MIRSLLLLLGLLLAVPVHADELRPGYLEFTEEARGEWTLVWKAPMRGGLTPQTQPILPKNCKVSGDPTRAISGIAMVSTSKVACNGDVSGHRIGLSNFGTSQTDVLVRVQPLGRPVQALRLTPAEAMAEIRSKPDSWQVARTYFVTGVEHILFGYDHLLFVVSLVLLLSGFWTIAKAVTAFTVAHSITLIGTTLGFLGLPQRPVESVIALSILFLAVEIVKKRPDQPRLSERIPWVVAFGFGLLHGFGFAGALNEIGLPESDVPTALLTFNLGVEAGQLVIVALSLAALELLRRFAAALLHPALQLTAYGIGTISAYWFIERTFA